MGNLYFINLCVNIIPVFSKASDKEQFLSFGIFWIMHMVEGSTRNYYAEVSTFIFLHLQFCFITITPHSSEWVQLDPVIFMKQNCKQLKEK